MARILGMLLGDDDTVVFCQGVDQCALAGVALADDRDLQLVFAGGVLLFDGFGGARSFDPQGEGRESSSV